MYHKFLDPVLQKFTTGDYYAELIKAKEEYYQKAGVIYEDDSEYENRMDTFMDWYIFDRPLTGIELSPIRHYYNKSTDSMSIERAAVYKAFCNTIHSIFYLTKTDQGMLHLEDLFIKKEFQVRNTDLTMGFMKGDIFEARLIPFGNDFYFARGFCFHPVEIEKFIFAEIKKVRYMDRTEQTKLILQLASMKLKHTRFSHINIKYIYTFDPKF